MQRTCKQVLVIEDDELIVASIQDVLESQGYDVVIATNGLEGIEKLNETSPPPCMILLDMMMPKMNGWQFLDFQRSSEKFSAIPVVICSALKETAKTVQAHAFIEKPVEFEKLMSAVSTFCK